MSLHRLCIVAALIVVGCRGYTGSTGPRGNANVVTDNVTLADSQYNDSTWDVDIGPGAFISVPARIATVQAPAITAGIADSGVVLVYINRANGVDTTTQWTPLPFTAAHLGYLQTFDDAYATGILRIAFFFSQTDANNPPPVIGSSGVTVPQEQFKYVAIAGSTAASLAALHVDVRNYVQVMTALATLER